jgi:hypothetical protein
MGGFRPVRWAVPVGFVCVVAALAGGIVHGQNAPQQPAAAPPAQIQVQELPVFKVPIAGEAAEGYFSPDGKSMICNAKFADDKEYQVYTFNLDGTNVRRINDKGADACSFYYPDGKKLIWTSTRDNLDMKPGSY